MMMNMIMLVGMYPVLFLLYFVLKNSAKPKKGLVFGVTMKKEWLNDEEMQTLTNQYQKKMKRNLLIMLVTPLVCFLTDHVSIQLTIWMIWLFAAIVAMELPFIQANKKVTELRRERGWQDDLQKEEYVELKDAGEVRRVKFLPFFWPMLVSAAAVALPYFMIYVFDFGALDAGRIRAFVPVVAILAVCTPLFYLIAVWMDRRKTDVISTDSDVNINYARAKKNVWKNLWLQGTWGNALYALIVSAVLVADFHFLNVVVNGALIYTIVLLYLCFAALQKIRKIEKAYEEKKDLAVVASNDEGWYWGVIYYNPKDHHSLVETRMGTGTTVNMATTLGKVMIVIAVVALLSIPVMCGWCILEEFVPIQLQVSDEVLYAKHLDVDYEIPVEKIENLTVIEELPDWTKRNGSAMDNLEKGKFYVHNVGPCEAFVNPQNTMFLQFTAEDVVYYMSGIDDAQTMEVYEMLQE